MQLEINQYSFFSFLGCFPGLCYLDAYLLNGFLYAGSDKEGSESSRWAHRRVRTEEKLRELGQVRTLERMIPGADIARFFRGDHEYITDKILELVGPNAKKTNFTDVLALAEQYRVDRWQVDAINFVLRIFSVSMFTAFRVSSC